ncbi:MAG: hypothetical protein EA397_06270 [Deltaproteobacteria bacterium]|nr:MAG: hypothetical protein EA397_06270 [Deltaproteobacteria bacterium]
MHRVVPHIVLSSVLSILGVVSVAHAADCVAHPSEGTSLMDCLHALDDEGGVIHISPGEHAMRPFDILGDVQLLAEPSTARPLIRGSVEEVAADPSPGLDDQAALFNLKSAGARLRVVGVDVRPMVVIFDTSLRPRAVNRIFDVDQGDLVLEDVTLSPEGSVLHGGRRIWVPLSSAAGEQFGGLLARVRGGGSVLAQGVTVERIEAPSTVGVALLAQGEGSAIRITGASSFSKIESRAGAVAAIGGANLQVEPLDGHAPTFSELRSVSGGALHGHRARVAVEGALFRDNGYRRRFDEAPPELPVDLCGGDIAVWDGAELFLNDVQSEGARASRGGSVCAVSSATSIEDSSFSDFGAREGGALWISGLEGPRLSVSITGTSFEDGALSVNESLDAMAGDHATHHGGAIFLHRVETDIRDSTFRDNTTLVGTSAHGGAIAAFDAEIEVRGSEFVGNEADHGCAVFVLSSQATLRDVRFARNGSRDACEQGGGLWSGLGSLELTDVDFEENASAIGGAAMITAVSQLRMKGGTLRANAAGAGGALWILSPDVRIDGVDFEENSALGGSGGHLVFAGPEDDGDPHHAVSILDSAFSGGRARIGGAVSARRVDLQIHDSVFSDHEATGTELAGGAIATLHSSLDIERSRFSGGSAGNGGAILTMGHGDFRSVDTDYLDNEALAGGALYLSSDGHHLVERGRMCRNRASNGSAIAYGEIDDNEPGTLELRNLIALSDGPTSNATIWSDRAGVIVEHSAIVSSAGTALEVRGASLNVAGSLFGWSRSAEAPVVRLSGGDLMLQGSVHWPEPQAPLALVDDEPAELGSGVLIEHPHLRGALRGRDSQLSCELSAFHPRPFSPLLLDGWPAEEGDPLIGPFGGEYRHTEDWRRDADDDGVPAIFDCDDHDPALGAWLVQYVDNDGDGVGGELWEGDDCDLVEGNVLIGGDCDDDDPDNTEICDDPDDSEVFYGASCGGCAAVTSPKSLLFSFVLLGALALRRRR